MFASRLKAKPVRRRLLALVVIFSLLILPVQASSVEQVSLLATNIFDTASLPVRIIPPLLKRLFGSRPVQSRARKTTQAERNALVASIKISPLKFVGYQGQSLTLSAQASDSAGNLAQGVTFSWESSNTNILSVDAAGKATFLQPGQARITCRVGGVEASAPVLVRPGTRPHQTDDEWRQDQHQLKPDGTVSTGTTTGFALPSLPKLLSKLTPSVEAQSPPLDGYDELWSDPANLVGSPNNRPVEPTRVGTVLPEGSNASFAVPLVNLGGRGLGTSLNLYYNSRVWSRRSNQVAFDVIHGEPAPGFSLGFGKLVTYGYNYVNQTIKVMWVAADGTRHYLGSGPYYGLWDVKATDGSDIRYQGYLTYGGGISYPNGVTVGLQPAGSVSYPTQITEPSGNFIQIAYKTESCDDTCSDCTCLEQWPAGKIDYITDTLGRVIQFNYTLSYGVATLNTITLPDGHSVATP